MVGRDLREIVKEKVSLVVVPSCPWLSLVVVVRDRGSRGLCLRLTRSVAKSVIANLT